MGQTVDCVYVSTHQSWMNIVFLGDVHYYRVLHDNRVTGFVVVWWAGRSAEGGVGLEDNT